MSRSVAILLVLVFLTASLIVAAKPVSAATLVENSWTSKASMHVARSDLGVAVVNGKIYAIGGNAENGVVGTNEEYDTETDTWTYKTPMPTPSSSFATAVYQNKIYCIGGEVNAVYDPATDTWKTKTPMPTPTSSLHAHVFNGKIYLIGGTLPDPTGFSPTTLNQVYDPETDSWTMKTPMPTATSVGASVMVDDKIYVIGGLGPSRLGSLNQIYYLETDTWSLGATPPWQFGYGVAGATAGVNAPKRIYCVYEGNQVYNPINDSWTSGADVPTGRMNFAVAVVDDRLYAIGGLTHTYSLGLSLGITVNFHATNERYTPFGYGTVPPAVAVVSPENGTYASGNVSLAFTLNKLVLWMGYSLDSQANVTVTGNTTLAGLTSGLYNVTVYAKDEFENTGASETIHFTIAEEPEPSPATLVAVTSAVTVTAVGISLMVYLRKRHHKT
jgi:hypothetical protein